MSIKTELKEKLKQAQERKKELEREEKAAAQIREAEARKFLEEVVCPPNISKWLTAEISNSLASFTAVSTVSKSYGQRPSLNFDASFSS